MCLKLEKSTYPVGGIALFTLGIVWLLAGCSGVTFPSSAQKAHSATLRPRMQLFVAPAQPVQSSRLKVILMPARVVTDQTLDPKGVSLYVQSVFLQHRVFDVLECCGEAMSESQALALAKRRGFDLVFFPSVVKVLPGQGDSPGMVAMRFRVVRASNPVTLWDIYGEADLSGAPDRYFLIWRREGVPPPPSMAGITAITRAAAQIISGNPVTSIVR